MNSAGNCHHKKIVGNQSRSHPTLFGYYGDIHTLGQQQFLD